MRCYLNSYTYIGFSGTGFAAGCLFAAPDMTSWSVRARGFVTLAVLSFSEDVTIVGGDDAGDGPDVFEGEDSLMIFPESEAIGILNPLESDPFEDGDFDGVSFVAWT